MHTSLTPAASVPPAVPAAPSVQIFASPVFGSVRVIERDGTPWFVAKDVCDALGYSNARDAVARHCKTKGVVKHDTLGGRQELSIIPEPDLYRLIMHSKLPAAEKFEEWVVGDVLPSIRQHGGYLTPATLEAALTDPDTIIRLATSLKAEREKRIALEARSEADRPKVVFADSIAVSHSTILVGELAKLIKQATGRDMGQRRMFDWLRDNGYLHKRGSDRNMPTQRSMELGLFVIKEGARIGSGGECHITKTAKVTGKGQIYFVNKFQKGVQA